MEGFERYTEKLGDLEIHIMGILVNTFRRFYTSKDKAVAIFDLQRGLLKLGFPVDEESIKKILSHMRYSNIIPNLMVCPKGYYIEEDQDELKMFASRLKAEAKAMIDVQQAIIKYCK